MISLKSSNMLVLGWVTIMGQKERNKNSFFPSLLSCGVALKSANQLVLCYVEYPNLKEVTAVEMQTSL